ncbi:MAG TPA: hypothetical protein VJ872_00570 [Nocardioides sp.]|nr:hypothetical protein [Nocardioides sp.]
MRVAGLGAGLLAACLLSACSTAHPPVYQADPHTATVIESYDGTLDPSSAVLPLVPAAATRLELTDFSQVRLTLGFGELTGRSPAADRVRFWSELPTTAALSPGLLHPVDAELRRRFGFGADDVSWEATYSGGGQSGWVMSFRESLSMAQVARAAQAKVGVLKGAVVDQADHLVTSAAPPAGADSWGHDAALVALVGRPADATYLQRGCLDLDSVFGAGTSAQLASGSKQMVGQLQPLDGFAIAFGGELATVTLGEDRTDIFARLRLAGVLPAVKPDFGTGFAQGVADPSTGRLGYQVSRPAVAAQLTTQQKLPFAVCAQ